MLVAARHPELVERVVVIEASPERDPGAAERIRAFFAANPGAYGGGIDPELAAATVSELELRDWWDEWRSIRCRGTRRAPGPAGGAGRRDSGLVAEHVGHVALPDRIGLQQHPRLFVAALLEHLANEAAPHLN